ncbi:unnamed protein product [Gongylonema pulchrum]|uniref:Peptidase_M14 domain-containing protein n=1 Tax=Gongylonema pulchrum TaxID=637853 RepID=A0A183EWK9_9BILA|nr:unnamed protein product [Gongylonema pulchrum]
MVTKDMSRWFIFTASLLHVAACGLYTDKIIENLEQQAAVENYTEIMKRIGSFVETSEIKVRSNDEILDKLNRLHTNYPHITYMYDIGRSVKSRPLTVLAIGIFPDRHYPGVPEFKYVANIHGNEVRLPEHPDSEQALFCRQN